MVVHALNSLEPILELSQGLVEGDQRPVEVEEAEMVSADSSQRNTRKHFRPAGRPDAEAPGATEGGQGLLEELAAAVEVSRRSRTREAPKAVKGGQLLEATVAPV